MSNPYQREPIFRGKLRSEQQVEVRRLIIRNIDSSEEFRLKVAAAEPQRVSDYAMDFGMARGVVLKTRIENGTVYARIMESSGRGNAHGRPRMHPSKLKYPFSGLEVGESVLINLPVEEHSKVRKSAWAWGKDRKQTLRCNVEGTAIRVTRTA